MSGEVLWLQIGFWQQYTHCTEENGEGYTSWQVTKYLAEDVNEKLFVLCSLPTKWGKTPWGTIESKINRASEKVMKCLTRYLHWGIELYTAAVWKRSIGLFSHFWFLFFLMCLSRIRKRLSKEIVYSLFLSPSNALGDHFCKAVISRNIS